MNNKCSLDDARLLLAYPLILLFDALLKIPAFANYLFKRFGTKESIRNILDFVYSNSEAVDNELVDLLHGHSQDEGYLDVFVSVITGRWSCSKQTFMFSKLLDRHIYKVIPWTKVKYDTKMGRPLCLVAKWQFHCSAVFTLIWWHLFRKILCQLQ